jgi:hypothetical protein
MKGPSLAVDAEETHSDLDADWATRDLSCSKFTTGICWNLLESCTSSMFQYFKFPTFAVTCRGLWQRYMQKKHMDAAATTFKGINVPTAKNGQGGMKTAKHAKERGKTNTILVNEDLLRNIFLMFF